MNRLSYLLMAVALAALMAAGARLVFWLMAATQNLIARGGM